MKRVTTFLFVAVLALLAACAIAQTANNFTLTIPGPAPTQLNITIPAGTQATLNGVLYDVSGTVTLNPHVTASIPSSLPKIGSLPQNKALNRAVHDLVIAAKPTLARR